MKLPFWGTNKVPFLRDIWSCLFERQMKLPFWGTNEVPFLRDKWSCLFEGQMKCPFWGTNEVPFLRDKWNCLFKGPPFSMTNQTSRGKLQLNLSRFSHCPNFYNTSYIDVCILTLPPPPFSWGTWPYAHYCLHPFPPPPITQGHLAVCLTWPNIMSHPPYSSSVNLYATGYY